MTDIISLMAFIRDWFQLVSLRKINIIKFSNYDHKNVFITTLFGLDKLC